MSVFFHLYLIYQVAKYNTCIEIDYPNSGELDIKANKILCFLSPKIQIFCHIKSY